MALTLKRRAVRLFLLPRVPPRRWMPLVTRSGILQRLGVAFILLLALDGFFWFVIAAGDFRGLSSSQSAVLTAIQAGGPVSLLLFPEPSLPRVITVAALAGVSVAGVLLAYYRPCSQAARFAGYAGLCWWYFLGWMILVATVT